VSVEPTRRVMSEGRHTFLGLSPRFHRHVDGSGGQQGRDEHDIRMEARYLFTKSGARMLNALENAEYENVLERIVDTDKVEYVRPCVPRCPRPCYLQDHVAAPVRYYQIQDLKSQFLEISYVPRSHCPIEHGRIP
jgi:hypothetical protein